MHGELVDLTGAIDLHCHPYPDLFPRLADDTDIARHARGVGLRAVMIKCHHEPSVSRAYHTRRSVGGIEVFGGIVLNNPVGGINPYAVEAALRLGGKEVWMPTVDAANHARAHGGRGYDVQSSARDGAPANEPPLLTVLGDDGRLNDATIEVLDLVAAHDAILGSCHLAPEEIVALVTAARQRGVERIVITHPFFKVPNLDLDTLTELARLGAHPEFGYCTISPMWRYADPPRIAHAVQAIGAERCLLVSDTGQRHNPMPAEALRLFAQSLFELGVTQPEIDLLVKENPRNLLDLPPGRGPGQAAAAGPAGADHGSPAADGCAAGPAAAPAAPTGADVTVGEAAR